MTTKGNGKAPAVETGAECPPDWQMEMDTERPIREALGICRRHGITLSGSTFEKASRKARRLSFEVHRLGGNIVTDEEAVTRHGYQIAAIEDRRAAFAAMGRLTTTAGADFDTQIAATKRNLDRHQRRVDQLSGVVHQKQRQAKVEELRHIMGEVGAQIDRWHNAGTAAPDELEATFDGLCISMDRASAEFAAGAAELDRLSHEMTEAEREARHGLATALRDRVTEKIADRVREAMKGKVALFARRPDKELPPEVKAAMREAETVCGIADQLAGEGTGLGYLARHLEASLRGLLMPAISADRRRVQHPTAGLMERIY